MKKNFIKISLALICTTFITVNAMAEARPVWILGHACNAQRSLNAAINDGACGVEIDVMTDQEDCLTDWSVNHQKPYKGPKTRNFLNFWLKKDNEYLSLKEYLSLPDMNRINVLYLDVKVTDNSYNFPVALVKHVHSILESKYGKGHVPYSIVYAFYETSAVKILMPEIGSTYTVLDWLRDNLWENEGINFAWECKDEPREKGQFSGYISDIESLMKDHSFPAYKHAMCHGYLYSATTSADGENVKSTLKAQELRKEGKYCSRIGFWTCVNYSDAIWFIDPDYNQKGVQCDWLLVEGHNSFILGDGMALWKLHNSYFTPTGAMYKKYNKGRFRIANQSDVFYDSKMMGK